MSKPSPYTDSILIVTQLYTFIIIIHRSIASTSFCKSLLSSTKLGANAIKKPVSNIQGVEYSTMFNGFLSKVLQALCSQQQYTRDNHKLHIW